MAQAFRNFGRVSANYGKQSRDPHGDGDGTDNRAKRDRDRKISFKRFAIVHDPLCLYSALI